MTEERARRRARLASGERGVLVEPAADALTLYAVFTGVPFAVAAYCLTVQRAELGAVGLTFLLIGFAHAASPSPCASANAAAPPP